MACVLKGFHLHTLHSSTNGRTIPAFSFPAEAGPYLPTDVSLDKEVPVKFGIHPEPESGLQMWTRLAWVEVCAL